MATQSYDQYLKSLQLTEDEMDYLTSDSNEYFAQKQREIVFGSLERRDSQNMAILYESEDFDG